MKKDELDKLRLEIRNMKPGDGLFEVLRKELTRLKLWINEETVVIFLKKVVPTMQRWNPVYKTLKSLLNPMGYWRDKKRGDPKLGFKLGFGKNNRRLNK